MDLESQVVAARVRADEAQQVCTLLRQRCAQLEHAKDGASDVPDAFEEVCDQLSSAQRDLDRAERVSVRAAHALRTAERAQMRAQLGGKLEAYTEALADATGGKLRAVAEALATLHGAVSVLERCLLTAGGLSEEISEIAGECGDGPHVLAPSEIRGLAMAHFLSLAHAAPFQAANLRPWLTEPPRSPDELLERLREVLSLPMFTGCTFRDLDWPVEDQIAAMLNGSYYEGIAVRRAEEARRVAELAAARDDEARAEFEADVSAQLRAGAADRRTAEGRAFASMRHDASVVLAASGSSAEVTQ